MATTRAIFNPSDMRFLGTLQQNQPVSDGSGGESDNWVNLLTTRCALTKESGKLQDGMGKMEYNRTYTLICRYQIALGTFLTPVINADTRWMINNEVYKVTDFDRVDLIPHFMTFQVIK